MCLTCDVSKIVWHVQNELQFSKDPLKTHLENTCERNYIGSLWSFFERRAYTLVQMMRSEECGLH